MSANRANASARNKRAGGAEMPSPQQQQPGRGGQPGQGGQPGRGGQPQTIAQNPKISISDAIGLVSLRLGRLETFMYTLNHEGLPSSEGLGLGENDRIIDDEVFRSIVGRLDALEKNIDSISSNQNVVASALNIENDPSILSLQQQFKDYKKDRQLEIYEVKDMILKLQTFSMETNSALKNLTEEYESDKLYFMQENNVNTVNTVNNVNNIYDDVDDVDVDDNDDDDDDVDVEVLDYNNTTIDISSLKDIIKREISM